MSQLSTRLSDSTRRSDAATGSIGCPPAVVSLNFTASAQKCVGCQKNTTRKSRKGGRDSDPRTVAQAMRIGAAPQMPPHSVLCDVHA